jgi:hypothetical protein
MPRPSKVVARCGALVKSRFFGSPARVSVWFVRLARAPQPTPCCLSLGRLPVCARPHGLGRRPDAWGYMAERSGGTAVCRGDGALPRLAERIVGMAPANAL